MKRNNLLLIFLGLLIGKSVLAAGPIDFVTSPMISRLKQSISYPIDLYQSTANQQGKYFTARTILRLSPVDPLSESDQKSIRNEICASSNIYTFPVNQALALKWMPGSMGAYAKDGSIVSIADQGLMGEPLDSVLRKLSNRPQAEKIAAAQYYAVAMAKNLEIIHQADIIWNNANLRNFYVRPEGNLYAYDFSEAEKVDSVGNVAVATAKKGTEWKDFVVNTVANMYRILFPAQEATNQFLALVTAGGVPNANVRTHAWDQAAFTAALNGALTGVVAPNAWTRGQLGNPGNYATNAIGYLEANANIPYRPSFQPAVANILVKADHVAIGNGANGFGLDPTVLLLTNTLTVLPAVPYADLTALCLGWDGK